MEKKKPWKGVEAVGWVFWCVCFGVLLGPCVFLMWRISYEDARERFLPILLGSLMAAFGAGFLSWATNAVVQRMAAKKRRTERKKSKKRK